jgi:dienelactone hydrolase
MRNESFDYNDGDLVCEGYVAYDDVKRAKRPCVLVCHAWGGQSDAERQIARDLAQLGYVGLAIDVYGKGVRGDPLQGNEALMQPFMADRALLRRRMIAAVAAAKQHAMVDADRIGAIGYCFGGLCALDLARSGAADVRGVVSFHGIFYPPNLGDQPRITAKILLLHGYADPMAPPEHVLAIAKELTEAKADWQLHAYGHTMHAFTFPGANLPSHGIMYNPAAARRSWIAMKNFFEEVLG